MCDIELDQLEQARDLPPQWKCAFCSYAEYVTQGDWTRALRRRDDHERQCIDRPLFSDPFPASAETSDNLMAEAWNLTNGDRAAAYGDAAQVFTAYGWAWSAILASKLQAGVFIDAADATLMMAALKICREANKIKRDNVVDAHGYLSLHSRVTGLLT